MPVQEALLSGRAGCADSLRERRQLQRLLDEALATQWLDHAELEHYQQERLAAIIAHSRRSVAFYRERDRLPLRAGDSMLDYLRRLPLLSRSASGANASFVSSTTSLPVFKGSTSGTTGMPLSVSQDINAICRENAFIRRQMIWVGWKAG